MSAIADIAAIAVATVALSFAFTVAAKVRDLNRETRRLNAESAAIWKRIAELRRGR